jgi:hypothetical protein
MIESHDKIFLLIVRDLDIESVLPKMSAVIGRAMVNQSVTKIQIAQNSQRRIGNCAAF